MTLNAFQIKTKKEYEKHGYRVVGIDPGFLCYYINSHTKLVLAKKVFNSHCGCLEFVGISPDETMDFGSYDVGSGVSLTTQRYWGLEDLFGSDQARILMGL